MDNLIDRAELYKHIAELEELARNRVCDTPTNSPAYMRYVAQLNERTYLKHEIADALTIDPVHAAGACYCRECKYQDECICRIEFIGRNPILEQNTYEYHPLHFCSHGQRLEDTK